MIESIIVALISICGIALVIYLVLWVLQTVVGISLPGKVIQILWLIFALICILYLVRIFLGSGMNFSKLRLSEDKSIALIQPQLAGRVSDIQYTTV